MDPPTLRLVAYPGVADLGPVPRQAAPLGTGPCPLWRADATSTPMGGSSGSAGRTGTSPGRHLSAAPAQAQTDQSPRTGRQPADLSVQEPGPHGLPPLPR